MAKEILDAEQLDTMWPTDATSESDYEAHLTRIEGSLRELRNQRTRVKTLEDALDAYDGLVADAYKIRELGLDAQVSALKAIGQSILDKVNGPALVPPLRQGRHHPLRASPGPVNNSRRLRLDIESV